MSANPLAGDETFDISVEKPLWLMVSVRDRALIGKHDTVGRTYICLDPRRYGDFLTHDEWFKLDDSNGNGRILLRISMEGEKDDPQFYFGRAFRSLKRAESDMVRVFVDKVFVTVLYHEHRLTEEVDLAIHPPERIETHSQDTHKIRNFEHRLQ